MINYVASMKDNAGLGFKNLLKNSLTADIKNFFSTEETNWMANKIYMLKEHWVPNYGGEQYTLGRVWYTHHDDNLEEEYFEDVDKSNLLIQSEFPQIYKKVIAFFRLINPDAEIMIRKGWAGPAFVIFPAGERCAEMGGTIHYDTDGLSVDQLASTQMEAYSFISMIQKPEGGGGLRIWDLKIEQTGEPEEEELAKIVRDVHYIDIDYPLGDLIIIDSLRIHQIQPFIGSIDRICLTFHAVRTENTWEIWF